MRVLFVIGLLLVSTPGLAAIWEGQIDVGASAATGNSDTITANAETGLSYEDRLYRHSYRLLGNYGEDNGDKSAERILGTIKNELKLGEFNTLFTRFEGEHDAFSSINQRFSGTAGYGRLIFKTPDGSSLNADIGAGMRWTRVRNIETRWEPIARAGFAYVGVIRDGVQFTQAVNVEGGEERIQTVSDTGLRFALIEKLYVKLGVNVKHTTDTAPGTDAIDTLSKVSIGWAFGPDK